MTHHLDLDTLTLDRGAHDKRTEGVCLLEAVAWWAEETHSDHPACVSPVLAAYGRSLNDLLRRDKRQELRPFIPKLPGTAGDGLDERRGYLALDWLLRTYTPTWLDLAGLTAEAAALRDFRRVTDLATAQAIRPHVDVARSKAAAAWDAVWDAAWAAAWDAAGDAAWDAARDAAWAAAWDAAGDAAWDAAGDAAWDAAWDAARAAAGDAAGDAARDAAWDAAGDAARAAAGDAARAAAGDALQPTADQLQDSAIGLFATMIEAAP